MEGDSKRPRVIVVGSEYNDAIRHVDCHIDAMFIVAAPYDYQSDDAKSFLLDLSRSNPLIDGPKEALRLILEMDRANNRCELPKIDITSLSTVIRDGAAEMRNRYRFPKQDRIPVPKQYSRNRSRR